ncbi:unnamed protein product [Brachionus calyciflorus]|uniref:Uncharacterized protein n=1 Tax=Brachionus calyciflorus TaxID=104777 RepID=A0A813MTU9_9BILA|nr:unnamed protein product [Brachionus calyciflorus]
MLAQKYLFILLLGLGSGEKIPLDDFVYNDSDLNIAKWRLINSTINNNQTIYKLKITTLKWFDDSLSNNSIWKHDLYITVPSNLNPNNPLFYYIHSAEDDLTDLGYVSNISNKCRCITITIRQIPNQPIKFTDDPSGKGRVEDEIIAWTMGLYLTDGRLKFPNKTYENIPLLFPMTKAAKRGMDLAINFLKIKGYNFTEKFIPSGKSKRGWTTWLLTAIDTRVIASVPIVYDIINWNLIIHDQYMSLGGRYSFALEDYFNQNITESIDSLEFYDLRRLIDPLSKT